MTRIAYFDCPSGVSGDMILGALVDAGLDPDELRTILASLPLDGYQLAVEPVTRGAFGATSVRVETAARVTPERHLDDVLAVIQSATLPDAVKESAARVFGRLADAEARVHRIDRDAVHFHEVGAVDAIVDVVGACAGLHALHVDAVFASPLPLGRGHLTTDHGAMPLPAPAVLELLALARVPTAPHHSTLELVTPTGAAILSTLARFEQPPIRLERVGYGAGGREEPEPNLLRMWLGEPLGDAQGGEQLVVLEANIDDMPAEFFGHAIERLLDAGALDAWCTPLTMKKSRPAATLNALCRPERRAALVELMMRETSTFGVRTREVTRFVAGRDVRQVTTPYGVVRVKVKLLDGVDVGAFPEYEDCRRLAAESGVALPQVYAAAIGLATH